MHKNIDRLCACAVSFIAAALFAGCLDVQSASGLTEIDFWEFPSFTSESGIEGDFEKKPYRRI